MVRRALRWFFGWTDETVAERLEGYVADGVYQDAKTRTTGGGYLSLNAHLEDQLNLAPGTIGCNYDMGHSDQLALGDVLIKDKEYSEVYRSITDPVFQFMGEFKNHKSKLIFDEVAAELKAPTINNMGRQETRWVRATIKAIDAFFRNSSVFHHIYMRDLAEAIRREDEEKEEEIKSKKDILQDPQFWAQLVALSQFLGIVASHSLKVQTKTKFPISALHDTDEMIAELESLGTKFLNKSML